MTGNCQRQKLTPYIILCCYEMSMSYGFVLCDKITDRNRAGRIDL